MEDLGARYRAASQIKSSGALANLGEGVEITAHGISTRLIAWPGTGFQAEAVHVLTIQPGEESLRYRYDLAEEALLCHSGCGEVWLREQWVTVRPGDLAYVPEGWSGRFATRRPLRELVCWCRRSLLPSSTSTPSRAFTTRRSP